MRQQQTLKQHMTNQNTIETETIQICVHGKHDIFGYQEMMDLEKDPIRRYSVECKSAEGVLVIIHKSHIEPFLRKNHEVLKQMVVKFNRLADKRIKNFTQVKKLRPKTKTRQVSDDDDESPSRIGQVDTCVGHNSAVVITGKVSRQVQKQERDKIEIARSPSPTTKLPGKSKDIPTKYQSFVDRHFGEIKNSMVSSVSRLDLKSM